MAGVGDIAAEHLDATGLHPLGAGDEAEQRGFADAIGTDEADGAVGRNVEGQAVERGHLAVAMGDALQADGRGVMAGHGHGVPCRRSGHSVVGSIFT